MKKAIAVLVLGLVLTVASAQERVTTTVFGFIKASEDMTFFATLLEEAGLATLLQGGGSFTIFVPTNEAFAALPPGQRNVLQNNPQARAAFLNRHILSESLLSGVLPTRGRVRNNEGSDLSFATRGDGVVVVNGAAAIVAGDVGVDSGILVENGVIHVIDATIGR